MLCRCAAFGVHHPVLCVAAQCLGKLFGAIGENIAEPCFASRAAFQQGFG
jgi:hypothetical protein